MERKVIRNYPQAYTELIKRLEGPQRILILGHKSPDGDSMGSALAMQQILKANGKEVHTAMSGNMPSNLLWLPERASILVVEEKRSEIEEVLKKIDLILCVDFNAIYRIGKELEQLVRTTLEARDLPMLMIDHHLAPTDEFTWQCSCPEAAATAEVIGRLFFSSEEASQAISPEVATCLMTGIFTDTGLFNHNSSDPELFELTAQLLRKKANKEQIINKVFHNFQAHRQRLEGYILYEKVQLFPEIESAYFTLSLEEQERFHILSGDTDGLVNKPLDIEGINCSAFFRETTDEGIKVSTRSIGDIAVNELCKTCYGGGGHKNASGGEMPNSSLEEAVQLFLDYMHTHHKK